MAVADTQIPVAPRAANPSPNTRLYSFCTFTPTTLCKYVYSDKRVSTAMGAHRRAKLRVASKLPMASPTTMSVAEQPYCTSVAPITNSVAAIYSPP